MKKIIPVLSLLLFQSSIIFSQSGIINTIAGNNVDGYSGDGGPATLAEFYSPTGVITDVSGNIFISDFFNHIVREVMVSSGIIKTIAGNYAYGAGYSGDGGQATMAEIYYPDGLSVDVSGNLFIADYTNNVIRKVNLGSGIITTVAGNYGYGQGYSGDGGHATNAELYYPTGVALDASANLYIADSYNNVIRKVILSSGIISTVAGNSYPGNSGDGGPAINAELNQPQGVGIDNSGNFYIGDTKNNAIRKVNKTSGIISIIAGNHSQGYSGDGGMATDAEMYNPRDVKIDANGNIYVADIANNAIRMVNIFSSRISTIAGNGFDAGTLSGAYSGDGGPATNAELYLPPSIALDPAGNLYIADNGNWVVRKVNNVTGISLIEYDSQIRVFPNPAQNQINIQLSGNNNLWSVELYSVTGQKVLEQKCDKQSVAINTTDIGNGLYFLKVKMQDGSTLVKKVEIIK